MAVSEKIEEELQFKGTKKLSRELKELADRYEHLRLHLEDFHRRTGFFPRLIPKPKVYTIAGIEDANVIYRVDDLVFAHAYARPRTTNMYFVVEPFLSEGERELYKQIRYEMLRVSADLPPVSSEEEYRGRLEELFNQLVSVGEERGGLFRKNRKFVLSESARDRILYHLKRDMAGMGPIDPLLKDKSNEDIHILGHDRVYIFHKLFRLMKTNVNFGSEKEYEEWVRQVSDRLGGRVSDLNPISDIHLPDGSRCNVVFPDDVSIGGPSITIRQFEETPISVFKLVELGTFSSEFAAYLWLCLESNLSIVFCGETAAGKTTALNASTAFIDSEAKIYTAEETPELRVPHRRWQRLLTRGGSSRGSINLFDLVRTSLRSRPDYIVVGEIRGEEAFSVFQAMQTGHPTLFTFHAGNIVSLVHRFTGEPLNVPEAFFGNLNVCVFLNFIQAGKKQLRRVTEVHEIEGYSKEMGGIVTRQVFVRNPVVDKLIFTGMGNSYILEEKCASTLGFKDPTDIYDELKLRAKIIERAVAEGRTGFFETFEIIKAYRQKGVEGLPFKIHAPRVEWAF